MSSFTLTGVAITAPTNASVTCILRAVPCSSLLNNPQDGNGTTINSGGSFCTSVKNTTLLSPPGSSRSFPAGLICDGTQQACDRNSTRAYTCDCYPDMTLSTACTQDAFSTSATATGGASGIWGTITGNNLYLGLFIGGVVIVGLIVISSLWKWFSGGYGFSPNGFTGYARDRKKNREERQRQRVRDLEARQDEDARIEANRLKRQQELDSVRMAGAAAAEMAAEQQRLAAEVARNRIEEERHGLVVAELKRRDELVEIVETGKDDAGRREAQRELAMIQLRAQRREEALKASGVNIKVVENLVIENGKVVGTTKNIVRERTALTDADAGRLMGDVAGDLSHANAPVAVTGASTNNRVQDVEGGML